MIRRRVRTAARAAGFLGVTGGLLPVYLTAMRLARPERREVVRDAWVKRWARALLRLFDVHVELVGAPPPPSSSGRLVVANHRSAIDVGVLHVLLGGRMVSRADLSRWPVIGAAARGVGTIFVDRGKAESGAGTIREIRQLLKRGGTVIVFPEGTTHAGDEVHPFHAGSFLSATNTGAEILPVGLAYEAGSEAAFVGETFPQHVARMAASSRPTRVRVAFGSPLGTGGLRAPALARAAHEAVIAQVARARASFDAKPEA